MADKQKPTKQQTLHKLASKRVPRTLRMLNGCANLAAYEPTEQQKKKILDAIKGAVAKIEFRFSQKSPMVEEDGFDLNAK